MKIPRSRAENPQDSIAKNLRTARPRIPSGEHLQVFRQGGLAHELLELDILEVHVDELAVETFFKPKALPASRLFLSKASTWQDCQSSYLELFQQDDVLLEPKTCLTLNG